MGANASSDDNNDDLIDKLLEANYIKTSQIERVFRAVDRGAYFFQQRYAYRDMALQKDHFHLSAPCIYSEVMEALQLRPGLSFLNLGSGTGYFSTLAGLILGSTSGLNHGIEIHQDVVEYARERLGEFRRRSGAVDEFDFCEPKFIQGNVLRLASEFNAYDRVYCGGGCRKRYLGSIRVLVKVGGILVIPVKDRLIQMRRVSETEWVMHDLLRVAFTNLTEPGQDDDTVPLIEIQPHSLQEFCKTSIRNRLRALVEKEYFSNVTKKRRLPKRKKLGKRKTRKDSKDIGDNLNSNQPKEIPRSDSDTSNCTRRNTPMQGPSSSSHEENDTECGETSRDMTFSISRSEPFMLLRVAYDLLGESDTKRRKKVRRMDREDDISRYEEEVSDNASSSSSNNSSTDDGENDVGRECMYISPYTVHMKYKIQELPLPLNLKKFLNYYREF